MKISVAMCTYNGAAFLQHQLDSLVSQTRQPDEVIICDDQSTDDTTSLLRRWARSAPFPVQVDINPERVGSTHNFDKAISQCCGDLIALCDQDDVWLNHKLSEAEAKFLQRPDLGVWFTDAVMVDEQLCPLPETLWEMLGFNGKMQGTIRGTNAFRFLLTHFVVTGATLVFPKRFRDLVRPIPTTLRSCIHDRWIGTTIAAVAPLDCSATPSMLYRQHNRQQLGVANRLSFAQSLPKRFKREQEPYLDDLAFSKALHERLFRSEALIPAANEVASLEERIQLLTMRTQLPPHRWRRLAPIAGALLDGRYHQHAGGIGSALKDLLL